MAIDKFVASLLEIILVDLGKSGLECIVKYDVSDRFSFTDFVVIGSCGSKRHACAAADRLASCIGNFIKKKPRIEGMNVGDWVLVDADAVIVHIFRSEVREFYKLDSLLDWHLSN